MIHVVCGKSFGRIKKELWKAFWTTFPFYKVRRTTGLHLAVHNKFDSSYKTFNKMTSIVFIFSGMICRDPRHVCYPVQSTEDTMN